MIPLLPDAKVFMPRQRALLAWNGEEEILLLSLEMQAAPPAPALVVLPLPAEPHIVSGDAAAFERVAELVGDHMKRFEAIQARVGRPVPGPFGRPVGGPPIQAQDVRAAHLADGEAFAAWVQDTLRARGAARASLPRPGRGLPAGLRRIAGETIAAGLTWFAFVLVGLGPEPRALPPIQLRFKTPYLYYPLRMGRLAAGDTAVEVFTFIPRALLWALLPQSALADMFPRAGYHKFRKSAADLAWVSPEMGELLGGEDTRLEVWQLEGRLADLEGDIMLPGGYVVDWGRPGPGT
jgi:hypothetical protein